MLSDPLFKDCHYFTSAIPADVYCYRVSVRSLFILEIFEETLRSIVRSPISTTKPPLISGFTLKLISLCREMDHIRALPLLWPWAFYLDYTLIWRRQSPIFEASSGQVSVDHCDQQCWGSAVAPLRTHRSACNGQVNLSSCSAHKGCELFAHPL